MCITSFFVSDGAAQARPIWELVKHLDMKELYRSRTSRVLGGVCGGIGEYMDIDPNIVRLVLIVILLFGFLTFFWPLFIVVLYIVAWILLPEKPAAESGTSDTG